MYIAICLILCYSALRGYILKVAYAAVVLIWGIVMLEAWKRKESIIALKRGMSGYDSRRADRPGSRDTWL